ncbi:MAG: hypothetical protein ABR568_22250, partial [Pyrinomonadaceae bacterium]
MGTIKAMKGSYRRLALLTVAVFLAVGVLSSAMIVRWWFAERPVWLSASSPNSAYKVELTGDKGRGGFIIESVVRYNLIKNEQLLVKNQLAHRGDAMDISFELAYPEHAWVKENVQRFWRNPDRPQDAGTDELLITNDTNKVINYLQIKSQDMFFVFDVQPHSNLKLLFSHQSGGNYIWCKGEFEDRSRIEYSANFPESKSKS